MLRYDDEKSEEEGGNGDERPFRPLQFLSEYPSRKHGRENGREEADGIGKIGGYRRVRNEQEPRSESEENGHRNSAGKRGKVAETERFGGKSVFFETRRAPDEKRRKRREEYRTLGEEETPDGRGQSGFDDVVRYSKIERPRHERNRRKPDVF